jgi:glycosyltransferase involved in cell wall biosynthesis
MEKYKKEFGIKIEFIHNTINHGAPYSRNKGFRKSRGEFLLFCDADIIFTANALETMHSVLQKNPSASYAYPSFRHGHKLFWLWEFDAEKLKQMPYIHSSALIRREHFPKNGWDENIKRLQDWDLWLTMLSEGHTGVWINKELFRIQGGGHTMSDWVPSFFYKAFPFLPAVKKYKMAAEVIKQKHRL